MTDARQEKLVGAIISLPTFKDENHNLLLDRQRKHIRWLIDQGIGKDAGAHRRGLRRGLLPRRRRAFRPHRRPGGQGPGRGADDGGDLRPQRQNGGELQDHPYAPVACWGCAAASTPWREALSGKASGALTRPLNCNRDASFIIRRAAWAARPQPGCLPGKCRIS